MNIELTNGETIETWEPIIFLPTKISFIDTYGSKRSEYYEDIKCITPILPQ